MKNSGPFRALKLVCTTLPKRNARNGQESQLGRWVIKPPTRTTLYSHQIVPHKHEILCMEIENDDGV